MKLKPLAI